MKPMEIEIEWEVYMTTVTFNGKRYDLGKTERVYLDEEGLKIEYSGSKISKEAKKGLIKLSFDTRIKYCMTSKNRHLYPSYRNVFVFKNMRTRYKLIFPKRSWIDPSCETD